MESNLSRSFLPVVFGLNFEATSAEFEGELELKIGDFRIFHFWPDQKNLNFQSPELAKWKNLRLLLWFGLH